MSVNIKENGQLVKTAGLNSQTVIIDNLTTQDATKALSAKQGYVLNQNKVDKVSGKGLSTNDYTNEEKTKLAGIVAGAEPNVQSDWKQSDSSSDDFIKNKPTSEIQTSDGQFTTVTGGLMQSCVVDLEPIQSGSGTPSPSNVRAISGHTSVDVGNCGKNKLPNNAITTTINGITWTVEKDANGNVIGVDANGTATGESNYYFYGSAQALNPLGQIANGMILSGCPSGGGSSSYYMIAGSLTSRYATDSGYSDTLSNVLQNGIRVICRITNGYTANHVKFRPMIRKATDSAEFKPYQGYTHTINLGGTYYGGTLNAVSGVLTVTHALVDLGDLTWGYYDNLVFFASFNLAKKPSNCICSKYADFGSVAYGVFKDNAPDKSISIQSNDNYINIKDLAYTDATTFKTAMSGVQLCYELATPQTIQLTPKQLETLVGQNDVFAPLVGQSVESLTYREVMAWDDVERAINAKLDLSSVAPIEYTNKASQSYNQKQLFIKDNKLCQALASISSGASFTENTNFKYTTLAEIIEPLIP